LALALFDLDNTLLAADSDHLWGVFLSEENIVDADYYAQENERFYAEYKRGVLDIMEFLRFSLKPLSEHAPDQLYTWREQFLEQKIKHNIASGSAELIAKHRQQGDTLVIITATNAFITRPIADLLGIEHLIATDPQMINGRYTGEVEGIPCFQSGKVERLNSWMLQHGLDLEGSYFYSDSNNDLPLLKEVTYPYAVDPDDTLREFAEQAGWPVISLRS